MDSARPAFCIGVDVGGTFTDVVLSEGTGVWRAKAPSTPAALGHGVLNGCRLVAQRAGMRLEDLLPQVVRFGLGTTAVTNVIATRSGRRVGLVTTQGFEELVPIARVRRIPRQGWLVPPDSLIDREWILGVAERVDRNGKVLRSLDRTELLQGVRRLRERHRIEAIAVSFLWSCANPAHEQQAVEAIRADMPDISVVSGAALHPVVREYERTTFALLNAYTSGALGGIEELVVELRKLGLPHAPLLVHSGGGSISIEEGRKAPATLAESGPAAGVVGALAVSRAAGASNAVGCDMGGTSFDMSIIQNGEALRRSRGDLMGIWTALPMVDIESVTAGGGSVGWIDAMGFLRVGPESAGSAPGPACYGRGGTRATVTDALVVLGYIDPQRFLGGSMRLDPDAAQAACAALGSRVGRDAVQIAWGIWEIARVEMARALRAQFAQKGIDPRQFAIVSMGGCGGLFNVPIAREIGMKRVLVPELTSVLSAFGAANADVRRERTRAVGRVLPADPAEPAALSATLEALAAEVNRDLSADGIAEPARSIQFEADMRFVRQQSELTVACAARLDASSQGALMDRFRDEYCRRYGRGALALGAGVELVALRAVGRGRTVRAELTRSAEVSAVAGKISGRRRLWTRTDARMERVEVEVTFAAELRPGDRLEGPILLDGADTTVWIPAGARARVDEYRTIDIEVGV
jgi:N-methylhydantoinase A